MRSLPVSWAASRFENRMFFREVPWSKLIQILSKPHVSDETFAEYLSWDREKQTQSKDRGYYIVGQFAENLRHNQEFVRRGTVTLDIDKAPTDYKRLLARTFSGIAYFYHTSRKSQPSAPRIRVHFPLSEDVLSGDEYEALTRLLASRIGIDLVDRVSYIPAQMMFFPSRSSDGVFESGHAPGRWLSPAEELFGYYIDWHDRVEWPRAAEEPPPETRKDKSDDPLQKPGIIGAFNRAYTVTRVLEELVPGAFEPAGPNRWRYHTSEGAGGAIVYDNDTALYSNHTGHDPGAGRSLNAWDVFRVHKFGQLDTPDLPADLRPSQRPSFHAAQRAASLMPEVVAELTYTQAFDDLVAPSSAPTAIAEPAPTTYVIDEFAPDEFAPEVAAEVEAAPAPAPQRAPAATVITARADTAPALPPSPSGPQDEAATVMRYGNMITEADSGRALLDQIVPAIAAAGLRPDYESSLVASLVSRYYEVEHTRITATAVHQTLKTLRQKARQPGRGMVTTGEDLPSKVEYDPESGVPLPTVANMETFLEEGLAGYEFAFDTFTQRNVWRPKGATEWGQMGEGDIPRLRTIMERARFTSFGGRNDLLRQALDLACIQQRYDSAMDWLSRRQWDGVPRIGSFFPRAFGVPDTPYYRAVGRYWWSALAGRIVLPGCKADMMPVLIGDEGIMKTSSVEAMAPDPRYFIDSFKFTDDDADAGRRMMGKLIAEIGELRGMQTAQHESILTFLSKRKDSWVPKYKEDGTDHARRIMFCGTGNKSEFIGDKDGSRRFLPMVVRYANVDLIRAEREQLYAEGLVVFRQLGNCVDYKEVEQTSREIRQDHMLDDSWIGEVDLWLDQISLSEHLALDAAGQKNREVPFTTMDALKGIGMLTKDVDKKREARMTAVLRRLGFVPVSSKQTRRKVWVVEGGEQ